MVTTHKPFLYKNNQFWKFFNTRSFLDINSNNDVNLFIPILKYNPYKLNYLIKKHLISFSDLTLNSGGSRSRFWGGGRENLKCYNMLRLFHVYYIINYINYSEIQYKNGFGGGQMPPLPPSLDPPMTLKPILHSP